MSDIGTLVDALKQHATEIGAAGFTKVEIAEDGRVLLGGAGFALVIGEGVGASGAPPLQIAAPAEPPPAEPEPARMETPKERTDRLAAERVDSARRAPAPKSTAPSTGAGHTGAHSVADPDAEHPVCRKCGVAVERVPTGQWRAVTAPTAERFAGPKPGERVAPSQASTLAGSEARDPRRTLIANARQDTPRPMRPLGTDELCHVVGCHGSLRAQDGGGRACDECGAAA